MLDFIAIVKSEEMAETKITFDRLNNFNWSTWRFRMELILMKEDLWSAVKDPKPEAKDVTAAWTRKDEKARWQIGLALDDDQLGHIMECKTANEMWETLKGYHERGSLSNKIHILRRLCSMRLDEGGNMSDHLLQASELVHRLTRLGEGLKEHIVVAILLSSLPESYNPLITALEGRPEEDLKLDYVKGKLLDEWRRRHEDRNGEKTEGQAMKTTVLTEDRRKVPTCYRCGEKGHIQWYCPVLLKERRVAEEKENDRAKFLSTQRKDSEGGSSSRGVCFTTTTGSDIADPEKTSYFAEQRRGRRSLSQPSKSDARCEKCLHFSTIRN